jgi:O-acetylserine/cysteine efflux transporter
LPPRHILLGVLVAVAWGVNFVAIHVGVAAFPPLLFASLRFTFVAFPAVLLLPRPRVELRWVLGVGAFLLGGQFAFLFVSIHEGLPAGLASIVAQLQVLFTISLAVVLLGERPRPAQLAGAAVALAGIAVIGAGRAHGVPLGAFLLCVCGAASWGVGNVFNRRAQAPDALALIVWASLVPPLPLAALSLALDGPHRVAHAFTTLDAGGVLALAYVVVVSTVFGYGAWTWLLHRHPASRVAPFSLLAPPIAIASTWVALGERPNAAELAGAAIVLAGLVVATSAARVRPAAVLVPQAVAAETPSS